MCVCCEEGSTIVSSCFPEVSFSKHSLYFSLARVFFIYFLCFFTWSLEFRNFLSLEITLWSTIVWIVWGVRYCVQLLPDVLFQTIPFPFPLLLTFPLPFPLLKFFHLLSYFFTWSLEFRNFLSLEITLWPTIVWFVWGVRYCVQLLPDVLFQTIPFPFPLLLTFPLPFPLLKFVFLLINYFLSFVHLKFSEMPNFPKYVMPD